MTASSLFSKQREKLGRKFPLGQKKGRETGKAEEVSDIDVYLEKEQIA